jgi:hypothetical protein
MLSRAAFEVTDREVKEEGEGEGMIYVTERET